MRLFELHRDRDISGVSGIGVVAEGVEFSDGTCVVRWVASRGSTVVWHSIDDVVAIHGHGGATRVVWLDPEAPPSTPVTSDQFSPPLLAPSSDSGLLPGQREGPGTPSAPPTGPGPDPPL